MSKLRQEFETRFDEFDRAAEVIQIFQNPFKSDIDKVPAEMQLESHRATTNDSLKTDFQKSDKEGRARLSALKYSGPPFLKCGPSVKKVGDPCSKRCGGFVLTFFVLRRRVSLDPFRRTRLQISGVKSAPASYCRSRSLRKRKEKNRAQQNHCAKPGSTTVIDADHSKVNGERQNLWSPSFALCNGFLEQISIILFQFKFSRLGSPHQTPNISRKLTESDVFLDGNYCVRKRSDIPLAAAFPEVGSEECGVW
ncbi:hypothetical protein J6590_084688 [Homalodisca vitripennis]|nr:hypothetical protein J6590_084688 [Homalodisca vitripennis]